MCKLHSLVPRPSSPTFSLLCFPSCLQKVGEEGLGTRLQFSQVDPASPPLEVLTLIFILTLLSLVSPLSFAPCFSCCSQWSSRSNIPRTTCHAPLTWRPLKSGGTRFAVGTVNPGHTL